MTKRLSLTLFLLMGLALAVAPASAQEGSDLTNWALGASYTYSMPPSTDYPDSGGQLTDGVFGLASYTDKAWVGHLRNDFRVITLDLGAVRPVKEVRANFLQDGEVAVRAPVEVIAEVSKDGATWTEAGFQSFNPFQMDLVKPFTIPAIFPDVDTDAQYVRLIIRVDVWMFIDEIEVLG